MAGEDIIHPVKVPLVHDGLRPPDTFLRRLKDDLHCSPEFVLHCHEHLGYPEADGGVAVVAAGMHHPGVDRAEPLLEGAMVCCLVLIETEGVDIEPKGDCRPLAAAKNPQNTRKSSLNPCKKLNIRPLLFRPDVMLLQFVLVGQPHPGLGETDIGARENLKPHIRKTPCNKGGRSHLEPSALGVFVKIPSDGQKLFSQTLCKCFNF